MEFYLFHTLHRGKIRFEVELVFFAPLFTRKDCVDLREKGSVYRKIFWARPISNFSISRPKGREIEIGDQSLAQKIFRYTDPFSLRSTHSAVSTLIEAVGDPKRVRGVQLFKKINIQTTSVISALHEFQRGMNSPVLNSTNNLQI